MPLLSRYWVFFCIKPRIFLMFLSHYWDRLKLKIVSFTGYFQFELENNYNFLIIYNVTLKFVSKNTVKIFRKNDFESRKVLKMSNALAFRVNFQKQASLKKAFCSFLVNLKVKNNFQKLKKAGVLTAWWQLLECVSRI
jgi:hypothetical protein